MKNEHLETVHKGKGSIIKEISRLISKYGDYGNIIVDEDGNVIHNADYAYCCKLLGNDVVVYKMHNEHVREFLMYLGIDYGEYNYETLGIKHNEDRTAGTICAIYLLPSWNQPCKTAEVP